MSALFRSRYFKLLICFILCISLFCCMLIPAHAVATEALIVGILVAAMAGAGINVVLNDMQSDQPFIDGLYSVVSDFVSTTTEFVNPISWLSPLGSEIAVVDGMFQLAPEAGSKVRDFLNWLVSDKGVINNPFQFVNDTGLTTDSGVFLPVGTYSNPRSGYCFTSASPIGEYTVNGYGWRVIDRNGIYVDYTTSPNTWSNGYLVGQLSGGYNRVWYLIDDGGRIGLRGFSPAYSSWDSSVAMSILASNFDLSSSSASISASDPTVFDAPADDEYLYIAPAGATDLIVDPDALADYVISTAISNDGAIDSDNSVGQNPPLPLDPPADSWLDQIKQKLDDLTNAVKDNSLTDNSVTNPDGTIPAFDGILPDFGNLRLTFSGIWHYVVEWVASLGAGFSLFFGTIYSNIPFALVLPIYATAVVVIVLAIFKRYIQ